MKSRSQVQVSESVFEQNKAEDSGGSIVVHTSTIDIKFCSFEEESVTFGYGGSICTLDIGNVSIQNSSFKGCKAFIGGSISLIAESVINIEDTIISESISNTTAGAVYVNHKSAMKGTNLSVINSSSSSGGGITCKGSHLDLTVGKVKGNQALLSHGGGIFMEHCKAMIDNFNISDNSALQHGGGLYSKFTSLEIHNTNGMMNTAEEMGGFFMATEKSKIRGLNLDFGENQANSGSNIALVNNSVTTIKHLHIYRTSNQTICLIVVQGSSHMALTSLYHSNSTLDIDNSEHNSSSMVPDAHVCNDTTSTVKGKVISGKTYININSTE